MGISKTDYVEFSKQIDFGNYFDTHDKDNYPEIVRNFHNEYSGLFIKKYAQFFEFPTPAHLFAIIQISRGHRKTDLKDDNEYPSALAIPGSKNTICVKYLSALIRLADEIDVTAARNSKVIYDLNKITGEVDIIEFLKHEAVKALEIKENEFVMKIKTDDDKIAEGLNKVASKMQKTLDNCRDVVSNQTPFTITQKYVRVEKL